MLSQHNDPMPLHMRASIIRPSIAEYSLNRLYSPITITEDTAPDLASAVVRDARLIAEFLKVVE